MKKKKKYKKRKKTSFSFYFIYFLTCIIARHGTEVNHKEINFFNAKRDNQKLK